MEAAPAAYGDWLTTAETRLDSAAAAEQFRSQLRWSTSTRAANAVRVLNLHDPAAAAAFERKLTRWYNACGCGAGRTAAVLTVAYLFVDWVASARSERIADVAGVAVVAVLGAAYIGKVLGLVWANMMLRRTLTALVRAYRTSR